MKKTVTLTSLIKAKEDLEVYIKVDEMKRLQKLFIPTFDLKDLNSKIEEKEDQLILIKDAIQQANTNTKDEEGHSINHSIYLLSKYNRAKSGMLSAQKRIDSSEFLDSGSDKFKASLLKDIKELDDLIKKETDKKKKSEHQSAKNKLKRSLSKASISSSSHNESLTKIINAELKSLEEKIETLKSKLTLLNNKTMVEVEVSEGFSIIV